MNIFKLMSGVIGTAITIGAGYSAQKKISDFINEQRDETGKENSSTLAIRAVTLFATITFVGGIINHIINRTF